MSRGAATDANTTQKYADANRGAGACTNQTTSAAAQAQMSVELTTRQIGAVEIRTAVIANGRMIVNFSVRTSESIQSGSQVQRASWVKSYVGCNCAQVLMNMRSATTCVIGTRQSTGRLRRSHG